MDDVGYNERGQLSLLQRPGSGGPDTTLTYYGATDNFRLSAITNSGSTQLPDFTYSAYDNVGNLTGFTVGHDSYTYTYDELNRLKTVGGAISRDYTYGQMGDLNTAKHGSTDWFYGYQATKSTRLMSITGGLVLTVDATQGYDGRGNLKKYTKGGTAYELTFDLENHLGSVKVGTALTLFEYDADGQRVRTEFPDGTVVYTPFPDYEITDPPSGANTTRTTYRIAGQIVAVRKADGSGSTLYYTYTDHLGNVTALSWTGGTFVSGSTARYDPFGAFTTTPTTNPDTTNHGFTGHRHNNTGSNDLGLIYMNARYYLPEVGRFVSPDSIVPDPSNPQSYNRYSYVRNSPMNLTDPTGHREIGANENDLLPNQPPPTISEQLSQGYNVYGITFTADQGEAWTNQQMATVLSAAAAVDRQLRLAGGWSGYMPGAAFRRIYGPLTFHRSSKDRDFGGETFSSKMEFYDKAFTVALTPQFQNNVVHELGHAFNAAIVRTTSGQTNPYRELGIARTNGAGELSRFDPRREGMGPYPWQQSTGVTDNEMFADFYLNWTYGSFLDNEAGRAMATWMDQQMHNWPRP